jgi:TolB protein
LTIEEEDKMQHVRLWGILLVVAVAALVAPSVFAGAPTGSGPNDPLMVTGNWQTLAANASLWFHFDYTGDKSQIVATLEDYGVSNVQLAIYTPAQANAWQQDPTTQPVAIGSPQNATSAMSIYDLAWRGAFNFPGRFFVVVTNNNPYAIGFRLRVTGDNVALAPTPTATPFPTPPFATPIPVGNLQGKLVFQDASGGNIYTVNGDGSRLTRVTDGLDPNWSPNGKQIAFTRWQGGQSGVYIVNADGSNETALLGNIRQPLSPRWRPDGKKIAFTRQQGGTQQDSQFCFGRMCFTIGADPHWKIGVVDAASGALTEPQCTEHCFAPTWSADNHTLAYADGTFGIMLADTTSNMPAWNLNRQNTNVQSPAWSPDGKKIAFMARQHDHWEIVVMDADGGNASPVTRADPLAFRAANNVAPAWSPDSQQILFLSDRSGKWEFFVANADGSNLQQVLKGVTDSLAIRYNFSNERVIDWAR